MQGRVPADDVASGRAAQGYTCNLTEVAHFGNSGGFKVHRYVDKAGHECAYYDSTLLFPTVVPTRRTRRAGRLRARHDRPRPPGEDRQPR